MQQVRSVPDPAFSTAPMTTVSGERVSVRRVKVPPTNDAQSYTGIRNSTGQGQTFIYFDLADNESFIDLSKMMMVADLTVYGPNDKPNSSPSYSGDDIPLAFDQSTQAFISNLTIGTAQGLKIEEIQNYNLLSNVLHMYTETSTHKEMALLPHSDYNKSWDKSKGLSTYSDGQLVLPGNSVVRVGETQRLYIRFHHASIFESMKMLPLFCLRNGIRIQVTLESAMKVFYSPIGASLSSSKSYSMQKEGLFWNWMIGKGQNVWSQTGTTRGGWTVNSDTSGSGPAYQISATPAFFPVVNRANYNSMFSYRSGSWQVVPSFNHLIVNESIFRKVIYPTCGSWASTQSAASVDPKFSELICIPITITENDEVGWSGFIAVNPRGFAQQTTAAIVSNGFEVRSDKDDLGDPKTRNYGFNLSIGSATGSIPTVTDFDGAPIAPFDISAIGFTNQAGNAAMPNNQLFLHCPMFSFNDAEPVPFVPYSSSDTTHPTSAEFIQSHKNMTSNRTKITFHIEDAFVTSYYFGEDNPSFTDLPVNVSVKSLGPHAGGAYAAVALWSRREALRNIRYELKNVNMLLEMVKPASDVVNRFQQMYNSPSGIPYVFTRTLYRKNTYLGQSGVLQVQLPISVRSMRSLLVILQDPAMDIEPANRINALGLPALSSFLRKGVTAGEVVVGGQMYPVYKMYLGPTDVLTYDVDHIPEVEKVFGVGGASSFNPSFTRAALKKVRNYFAFGWLNETSNSILSNWNSSAGGDTVAVSTTALSVQNQKIRSKLVDSSAFVMGFSLCKNDIQSFVSGIDSSQSGSVQLNLRFDDANFDNYSSTKKFDAHIFVNADAVFTLQRDANLVRF